MQEETKLPQDWHSAPSDEVIKLNCLQMAIDYKSNNPLEFAKEMYNWIKEKEWTVVHKEATEITIENNGETITIPLREVEIRC